MKKIYESPLNGFSESAERIHIYAIESEAEYSEISCMNRCELQEYFCVCEHGYIVRPGAPYYRYDFHVTNTHVIMEETIAYNV